VEIFVVGFIGVVVVALLSCLLAVFKSAAAKQAALLHELIEQGKVVQELLNGIKDSKDKPNTLTTMFLNMVDDIDGEDLRYDIPKKGSKNPWDIDEDDEDDEDDWDEDEDKPDPFGQDPDWWKKA